MGRETKEQKAERIRLAELADVEIQRRVQATRDAMDFETLRSFGERYATMPPEESFGKWRTIPGWAHRMQERWSKEPTTFWAYSSSGPVEHTGTLVQRRTFTKEWGSELLACGFLSLIWTVDTSTHGNGWGNDLQDYSENNTDVKRIGAATRDELCALVRKQLGRELTTVGQELLSITTRIPLFL